MKHMAYLRCTKHTRESRWQLVVGWLGGCPWLFLLMISSPASCVEYNLPISCNTLGIR